MNRTTTINRDKQKRRKQPSAMRAAGMLLVLAGLLWAFRHYLPMGSTGQGTAQPEVATGDQAQGSTGERSYLPKAAYGEVIEGPYFTLAYSEEHEQAVWVAYELTKDQVRTGIAERTDWFEEDTRVSTGSAVYKDYSGSGYSRGHLAPAADFSFDQEAMDQTFLMSNISPQVKQFNGGIWRELEEQIRDWTKREGALIIVTGPVFSGKQVRRIGKNEVAVPDAFYKVVLDHREPEIKGIAFLIPHEVSDRHLLEYAMSIRALEEATGIDFFSDLWSGRSEEDRIEKQVEPKQWPVDERRYRRRVEDWNNRK